MLRPYPGISTRNDEGNKIYNYRLSRARRVVENAFGILIQKCRLFCGRIRLSPANADKIILAACVLHSNLRNDLSVEDNVTENRCSITVTTFLRTGGNANKEVISVRKRTDSILKMLDQYHVLAQKQSTCPHQ